MIVNIGLNQNPLMALTASLAMTRWFFKISLGISIIEKSPGKGSV